MTSEHVPVLRKASYLKKSVYGILLLVVLGLCSIGVSCDAGLCYYCGSYYNERERFPTFDLCNTCVCIRDSISKIGRVKCDRKQQCEGYCYANGKKYSSKSTFQYDGKCTRCDCTPENVREFAKCGGIRFCLGLKTCQ